MINLNPAEWANQEHRNITIICIDDDMVIELAYEILHFKKAKLLGNLSEMDDVQLLFYQNKNEDIIFKDHYEYRARNDVKRDLSCGIEPWIARMTRTVSGHPEMDIETLIYPRFDKKQPFKEKGKRVLLRRLGIEPNYNGFKFVVKPTKCKFVHQIYVNTFKTYFSYFVDNAKETEIDDDE